MKHMQIYTAVKALVYAGINLEEFKEAELIVNSIGTIGLELIHKTKNLIIRVEDLTNYPTRFDIIKK